MIYTILFPTQEQHQEPRQKSAPTCFKDLYLDQIFAPILKEKEEFELDCYFYTTLQDREIILYRQDVMRELENDDFRFLFIEFSKTVYDLGRDMNTIRKALSTKDSWDNNYLTRGHMLDYAERYCHTISTLSQGLSIVKFHSQGLRGFADYLSIYCESDNFTGLCTSVKQLHEGSLQLNTAC